MNRRLFFLKYLLVCLSLCCTLSLGAQISEGGTPPSFLHPGIAPMSAQQLRHVQPDFDVAALKAEDKIREAAGMPPRAFYEIPVHLTPENSGEWTVLPNGQSIWRLTLKVPNAIALLLTYDKFIIPEGGHLFLYNAAKGQVIGAFTSNTNPKRQEYATQPLPGDQITLEYVPPVRTTDKAGALQLVIASIGYGYNHMDLSADGDQLHIRFVGTLACQVNVNCPEGDNWQDQKRGVARILTPIAGGGYGLCSGTIINNTARNLDPIFLSAFHCYDGQTAADMNKAIYYFNYEVAGCKDDYDPNPGTYTTSQNNTIVGATMLTQIQVHGGSDGSLLQLNDRIPENYGVYYNGWDRRRVAPQSGVGIGHPNGDVKKIFTYTSPAVSYTARMNSGEVGATGAYWQALFVATANGHGLTQGGASGSPLFDQNGRVVGTLTGGPEENCASPKGNSIYGALWYHYDQNADPKKRMKDYLDPVGSGEEYVNGGYRAGAVAAGFVVSKTEFYATESISFRDASNGATSWNWTFEGGTPASFTGKTPPLITYNVPGTYTAALTVNAGSPEESSKTVTITALLKNKEELIVGTGTAQGALPLGTSGFNRAKLYTAALYTPAEIERIGNHNITSVSWYCSESQTITTSTVRVYLKQLDASVSSLSSGAYNTYGAISAGAVKVAEYQNYTNPAGVYASFPFNAGSFTYDGASALLVIVETEYPTDATRNPLTPYTPATGKLRYWAATAALDISGASTSTLYDYRPNIKFTHEVDVVRPVAAFAMNGATAPITINEGDKVIFTDKTTGGPVVLWDWSMPGAEMTASTLSNPETVYMHQGTYNVTLKVKNTEGEDVKTLENAIEVKAVTPDIDFISVSTGWNTQSRGQSLPRNGGQVFYLDVSKNYPTSWKWSTPGGSPASSTAASYVAAYPAASATVYHDVSLEVSNLAATVDTTSEKHVQVGGTADIWNVYGDESALYFYQSAQNVFMTAVGDNYTTFPQGIAERFVNTSPGEIPSVKFYSFNVAGTVTVKVAVHAEMPSPYSDLPGTVGALLASATVTPSTNGYTTVTFPKPAVVSGNFYVVFTKVGGAGARIIPSTALRGSQETSVYASYQTFGWLPVNLLIEGSYMSMNVVPTFTYTFMDLTSPKRMKVGNIDSQGQAITLTSNASSWKASTTDSWIQLDDVSGPVSDEASIRFSCAENKSQLVRSGIINIAAGGNTAAVVVKQAGAAPTALVAEYNDEDQAIDLAWNFERPEFKGVFDNAEAHADFAINAPGTASWTYYDGDDKDTYAFYENVTFTNEYAKMAFMVMSPTKFKDRATGETVDMAAALPDQWAPHSGKKFFACVAATDGVQNNDWMISPELNLESEATVAFWAKSYSSQFSERFRVLYSTTGNAVADFIHVLSQGAYEEAPSGPWTRYSYVLPAEAKHVAINCVSIDAWMLMIDDISIGTGPIPSAALVSAPISAGGAAMPDLTEQRSALQKKMPLNLQALQSDVKLYKKLEGDEGRKLNISHPFKQPLEVIAVSETPVITAQAAVVRKDESDVVLRWDTGRNPTGTGVGLASGGFLEPAIYFTAEDLMLYEGYKLKAVELLVIGRGTDMALNIYRNGELAHTQPLTDLQVHASGDAVFNHIELTTPVDILLGDDLVISYEYIQAPKTGDEAVYVAGIDPTSATINGKGNLIAQSRGQFALLPQSIVGNWNLAAVLTRPDNNKVTFKVYANGASTPLIETDATTYTHVHPPMAQQICYSVAAVYEADADLESSPSEDTCVISKSVLTITADNKTMVENDAIPELTGTVSGPLFDGHAVTDVLDMTTFIAVVSGQSKAGVYPIATVVENALPEMYIMKPLPGRLTITPIPTLLATQPEEVKACIGEPASFMVTASGLELKYQWQKKDNAIWQDIDGATASSFAINAVTVADAAIYRVIVSGRSAVTISREVALIVGMPEEEVIAYEWSEMPTVNCNPVTNGGFHYTAFQWYRNGLAIAGATKPYISVPDGDAGVYRCEMQTDKGYKLAVCDFAPQTPSNALSVYPNPVNAGGQVTVNFKAGQSGSVMNVYNMSGGIEKANIPVTGTVTSVDVSGLMPGLYLIQLVDVDGNKQTSKLLVQ